MPSNKINFTKKSLQELPLPTLGKRAYYRDTKEKGLLLDLRPSGSMTFYLYKKIKGKPERIYLGIFPDLTIENARKKAFIYKGQIANGLNPQDEKRELRNEMTFKELFNQYMDRYSKLHKKSWLYDQREVEKHLSHWFDRKISDISKNEVHKLHSKLKIESGPYQANRILERIRAIYNKAIEWEWKGTNPALNIKKFKEKSRDRFVQPAEVPHLFRSLDEEENETAKDYFWILFLTGVRKTNTLSLRWEQINWERAEWRIPDSKNGDVQIIALTGRAINILKKRKEQTKSVWVFPSEENNQKHFINVKRAWKRILQRATIYLWAQEKEHAEFIEKRQIQLLAGLRVNTVFNNILKEANAAKIELSLGLMDIRIHDIRRTFGSYQAINGVSLQIIGQSLGHKSFQSTQVYARLNLTPVRAAIEQATESIFKFSEQ